MRVDVDASFLDVYVFVLARTYPLLSVERRGVDSVTSAEGKDMSTEHGTQAKANVTPLEWRGVK